MTLQKPLLSAALGAVAVLVVAASSTPPERPRGHGAVAVRGTPAPASTPNTGTAADWKEIDRLAEQQKLAEALEKAEAILHRAIQSKDEDEWTRALVRCVQLRSGLHGYETAVRFLKEQPWPEGLLPRVTLELYYAHALAEYARAYSWEIGQRERVESPQGNSSPIDLKAMTREQILAEARRADLAVWARRQALSALPVDRLAEYVRPNNYPKEVRGTLRDAVSYLFVELLADSSLWSPEQSNGVYRLSVARLLETAGRDVDARLKDPQAHPAEQIAEILGDLETWHASAGERGAELEARLERLRRLHAILTDAAGRGAIRKDLESRLPRYRSVAWWAMGMAELAQFREAEETPDDRIRAREAALEGAHAYPQSPGGRRCTDLVAAIERPDFQLAAMSSDSPNRRSIELTHTNVPAIFFRAYAVDLERRIGTAADYNLLPGGTEVRDLVRSARPAAAWTAPLPPTPDYKPHRTFVTPPLRAPGLYVVAASLREDFAESRNRLSSVAIVLSDLVLWTRPETSSVEARVVTGEEGRPVEGAEVSLYAYDWGQGRRHHRVEMKQSDAAGLVRFDYAPGRSGTSYFLLARRGADYALDPSYLSLQQPGEPAEETASLVYTDRSIYRPQQRVLWKVVAYRGRRDLGRLRTFADATVTLTLHDANNQVVESKTATTNAYGSAAGEFTIPAGRALGRWRIDSSLPGSAAVQVEEYKRPTFEVRWKDPETALRLNQPAQLVGSARYYFGLPVSSGSVHWRVVRTPEYPWWWWESRYDRGGRASNQQVIAQGQTALDADGTFRIRFTPEADERLGKDAHASAVTYRYEAVADATDEGGETRSDTRGFRLGFVSVEASVALATEFFRESVPGELTITRSDLDGIPRPGKGAWRLTEIVQPPKTLLPAEMPSQGARDGEDDRFTTPGDRLRPRWETSFDLGAAMRGWPDGRERAHGEVTHDARGQAALKLPPLAAGAWRLHYGTTDAFGARYETTRDFLVAGRSGIPVRLPGVLLAERPSVEVGETARFLLGSAIPGQTVFVETLRDGRVVSRSPSSAEGVLEIPVTEDSRGGFAVRLSLLRDHQFVALASSVFVPWSDEELRVEFATFRDKIRPGAKETWRVTVKAPEGSAAQSRAGADAGQHVAEILAYMYDRSLDAFLPHTPPSALALYPNHTSAGELRASLSQAPAQWIFGDLGIRTEAEGLYGDALRFFESYGIGGPGVRNRMMAKSAMLAGDAAAALPSSAPANAQEAGQAGGRLDFERREGAKEEKDGVPERAAGAAGTAGGSTLIRSNFAETAFWRPQLLTGADGSAVIEFEVPDSVTSWNVWVHAVTRDLKAGSVHRETQSVKDLMVRPYVPRFLREGDAAQLKIVVNNASDRPMSGEVTLDILDTETNASALERFGLAPGQAKRPFTVAPGAGADVAFALSAPKRVGSYAIRATAVSGAFSDGELRPVPVLPGRMQLAQSRFTALREGDRKTLTFADMSRSDDPSRIDEQLVVTVDAQLFYSVLNALPYLVNYPYECTEQTLNRFVSTGIVSGLYGAYPAVARMAQELSRRDTPLETWAAIDPNRKMALEETPWLRLARGGGDAAGTLNVLDPRVAKTERESALARLRKAQTSLGAFPWWPGGPPSPYMTLYILYGLAKASEFGVEVPKDMVQRGWQYLANHFREEYAAKLRKENCCWEFLTFLNYVASCYPDPSWMNDALKPEERRAILDFCFKHWKEHSPLLKGYLALTLKRASRAGDARLVWDSVMDSAKTDPDLGTYWAPEDRAWLWYNDTIETQAFALRTLLELSPGDARRHGLVQWLFLNKKLNQWKSTRATAEVIYSLVWYLRAEGALSTREEATVAVAGQRTTFVFEPDHYMGAHNQVVVPGEKLDPKRDSAVSVEKGGKGLAFASATWHFSTERLPAEERGDFFSVSRRYFKRAAGPGGFVLQPLSEGAAIAVGDQIEVQISLKTKHAAEYVHLRDPRAAGCEPESVLSRYKWDLGIVWYEETRDSGSNFFFEQLPAGEYTFKYRVRANMAGTYRVGPATVQSMYAPEFNAYSSGAVLSIR